MADRDLLLPRSVLVDRLFHLDTLGTQRGHDIVHGPRQQVEPDRGVAE